jgi:CheY-like chemotaxis protein
MPANPITPTAVAPPESFVEEVRAVLDHLYDPAYVHNHPLAWRLCGGAPDGFTRAKRVRIVLLDAIEQLRPEPRAYGAVPGDEMRAYAILTFRCLDGLGMDEIAAKLGLIRRQAYREYAKAVEAAASLVWNDLPPSAPGPQKDAPVAPASVDTTQEMAADPSRMHVAAEEVARLTRHLLLEPVDLASIVSEVVELLAPRVCQTGVELHAMEGAVRSAIVADRALLRQALLNFFSFALDQAGQGGAVEATWNSEEEATVFRIAVLQRMEAPQTKREGVGVAVAQRLVEAMGGQVLMQQTSAAWQCSLLLPAAECPTVLVVDDNADLTALFQRYTAGQNLKVTGATSGVQALDLARELRPQLIILDLMLAHMDGWEILQRLRRMEETATTPIVICSVLNERELAFSMGASDYVTKPINQATLAAVLQRWLGRLPLAV